MTASAADRPPAQAAGDDAVLDSLVFLVAENYGYSCRSGSRDAILLDGPQRLYVSMRNLRQLARQVARDDWPALVADHVGTIITAIEEPLDLSDFELASGLLRSRVYPAEADAGRLISRPFGPGLIEAVVADTPTTVRTVVAEDAASWQVGADAVFDVARAGVRADGPLEVDIIDDLGIRVLEGSTFYAATHLLWLESYLTPGRYGALVVAPTRSMIAACPVLDSSAVVAAERLHTLAQNAYEQGPGSLSSELYWWREGRLTLLETRIDAGRLVLPGDFLLFLAGLR